MTDEGLRKSGVNGSSIRKSIINDPKLPQRIETAIGSRVPADIRMDAVNQMYVELLDGLLRPDQIESVAHKYRSKAFEMAGFNYSTRSIDEQDENGLSLADTLADPRSLEPFDDVLKLVFANDD